MLRFWAYRARREGKPIPRWQLHALDWVEGGLMLREQRDDTLGRTVRVARFIDWRDGDVFPPLIEASLILADACRLIFTGLERDELTQCDRAQTWVLHINDARRRRIEPTAGAAPHAPEGPLRHRRPDQAPRQPGGGAAEKAPATRKGLAPSQG